MIHFIPLENLEERYTTLMNNIVNDSGLVKSYYPKDWETAQINKGEFLDIERTIEFKAKQLILISKAFQKGEIKNGDWIFFADIFFQGMESVKYMAELQGIKINVAGFNHAGRADKTDFVQQLGQWADQSEKAYHDVCDIIFVGSQFHKHRISEYFYINKDKIKVTGCVWNSTEAYKVYPIKHEKEDFVIFPHRLSKEKGVDDLLEIATKLPNKRFIITSSSNKELTTDLPENVLYVNNLTKKEYYKYLSKAKYYLSTAYQETFGYTLREALMYDCRIVAPNDLCYTEMLPKECLYDRGDIQTISKYLNDDLVISSKWNKLYDNSFYDMIKELTWKEKVIGTVKK